GSTRLCSAGGIWKGVVNWHPAFFHDPTDNSRRLRIALEHVGGVLDAVGGDQRRPSFLIADVELRALLEQELDHGDRTGAVDGAVQGGLAVVVDVVHSPTAD